MTALIGSVMTGGYGGAEILKSCTIAVESGEIAVIVGPNGAGKSTAMRAMFGLLDLRAGSVLLDGEDITALLPQHRVQRGMGFVPQTQNVFTSMTVEENLEMGGFIRNHDFSDTIAEIYDLFPVLKALVAPILPDPISLISCFKKIFVKMYPNGIEPIRYEIIPTIKYSIVIF